MEKYAKKLNGISEELVNTDFWNDANRIQSYCYGIVKYFGKANTIINVHLSEGSRAFAAVPTTDGAINKYYINLPKMPAIFKSEEERMKQVYMRSILLRHELSHILFTDWNWKPVDDRLFKLLVNQTDDIRIEKLFSDILKGSRNSFRELRYIFFENSKSMIEDQEICQELFMSFVHYSLMEFKFDITKKSIKKYTELFSDFENLIYLNDDDYKEKILDLWEVIQTLKKSKKSTQLPQTFTAPESGDPDDQEDGDREFGDSDDSSGENDGEDSEESEGSGTESSEESEGQNETGSDGQSTEEPDEIDDDLDRLENEGSDGGSGSDSDTELPEGIDEENLDEIKDLFQKPVDSLEDLIKNLATSRNDDQFTKDEIKNMKFHESDFAGAHKFNMIQLAEYFKGYPSFTKKDGIASYNNIVKKNQAVISDAVRFLKLKIQHRTYNRRLNYQAEGDLDQTNLKEIVINHDSPRAFYRTLTKIEQKTRMHIMMDLSGSMNWNQVSMCLVNATIMSEVCKRLKLDYGLYFFTSGCPEFSFKKSKTVWNNNQIKQIFADKISDVHVIEKGRSWGNRGPLERFTGNSDDVQCFTVGRDSNKNGTLYILKDINEKSGIRFDRAIGCLYKNVGGLMKFAGGTPEFECINQVYQDNKHYNKNLIFVINDGEFHEFLSYNVKIKDESIDHNIMIGSKEIDESKGLWKEFTLDSAIEDWNFFKNRFELCKDELTSDDDNYALFESLIKKKYYDQNDYKKINLKSEIKKSFEIVDRLFKIMEETLRSAFNSDGSFGYPTDQKIGNWMSKRICEEFKVSSLGRHGKPVDVDTAPYSPNDQIAITFRSWPELLYVIGTTEEYYIVTAFIQLISSLYNPCNMIYKKLIGKMRKTGWGVYGIGIDSDQGLLYIGKDNFMVLEDEDQIATEFGRKLREIF